MTMFHSILFFSVLLTLVAQAQEEEADPACAAMMQMFSSSWCVTVLGPVLPVEWTEGAIVVQTPLGFTGTMRTKGGGFLHLSPCAVRPDCHIIVDAPPRGGDVSSTRRAVSTSDVEVPPEEFLRSTRRLGTKERMRRRRRQQKKARNRKTPRPSMFPTVAPIYRPQCAGTSGYLSADGRACLPLASWPQQVLLQDTSFPRCSENLPVLPCAIPTKQTVAVYYSTEARDGIRDVVGLIRLAVAETNAIYVNSRIPIVLELVHTGVTPFAEAGDSFLDLIAFRGMGKVPANMAVFLVKDSSSCGRAYLDCAKYIPEFNCARAVVKASCATGYYTFAHELGHIQGADHEIPFGSPVSPQTRFTDNHGFVIQEGETRTVMAYGSNGETRLPYFSSPGVFTSGGRPTGVLGKADNARVLRKTQLEITTL